MSHTRNQHTSNPNSSALFPWHPVTGAGSGPSITTQMHGQFMGTGSLSAMVTIITLESVIAVFANSRHLFYYPIYLSC
jgi:hypothetical protein